MKKIIIACLVVVLFMSMIPFNAFAEGSGNVSQYLEATISKMVKDKKVKGAVVSVVSNGKIDYCKGYGYADEKNDVKADGQNIAFRIGSVSKTFVAIAAEQLSEKGILDMNTSVYKYLEKDFPRFKHDFTLNNLLTHTAGFEDMLSGIAVYDIDKAEPLKVSIRKYMPSQEFIPGQVVSYSNYGIALAAYIIERITGQDFYEYVEESIFKPLKMDKTSFRLQNKNIDVSKAYDAKGEETSEPFINLYPEGSGVSSADDMAKYMLWLLDDKREDILSNKGKQDIFARHFTMSEEFEGIGLTWNRREYNGVVYFEKKGETKNFFSRIIIYPGQKTGVFISFNTYLSDDTLDSIMHDISSKVLFGQAISNMVMGKGKTDEIFTGKQTEDISGYYIDARSNFNKIEKVMNFLIPDRVFKISGSISKGFEMNGKKLIAIGENYYSTPLGNMKYVERDGRGFFATDSAISYVRTSWYEHNNVQLLIVGLFALVSLFLTVACVIRIVRRKSNNILAGITIAQFVLFVVLAVIIFSGISSFTLLSKTSAVMIFGILLAVASAVGILYTIYHWVRKSYITKKVLLSLWSLLNLLFCLWMVQVNIL